MDDDYEIMLLTKDIRRMDLCLVLPQSCIILGYCGAPSSYPHIGASQKFKTTFDSGSMK